MLRKLPSDLFELLFIATTAMFVIGCGGQSLKPLEVGDQAPTFELLDAVSRTMVHSDSLKGQIVVLNFWSTTCLVCMKEIEELKRIQDGQQASVVGIAIDDDPMRVGTTVKAKGINYPVLSGNADIFTMYDGFSTPYTLVLDRNLVVRQKYYGPVDKNEIDQLLNSI